MVDSSYEKKRSDCLLGRNWTRNLSKEETVRGKQRTEFLVNGDERKATWGRKHLSDKQVPEGRRKWESGLKVISLEIRGGGGDRETTTLWKGEGKTEG